MKAFMKGFTSHGPNWGPGFRFCYTRAAPRRREPPLTPRGDLHSSSSSTSSSASCSLYRSLFARPRDESRFLYRSSKVPRFSSSSYPVVNTRVSRVDPVFLDSFLLFLSSFLLLFPPFFYRPLRTYSTAGISLGIWNSFATLKVSSPRLTFSATAKPIERSIAIVAREFSSSRLRSISFRGLRFAITIRTTAVVRVALMSASGSIGSPQLFCSPIKVLSQRAAAGGGRDGGVLLTLDAVQSSQ